MLRKLIKYPWSILFLLSSIMSVFLLIYICIQPGFKSEYLVFPLLAIIVSVMFHLGCALTSDMSDPLKFKITSASIWSDSKCVWEKFFFIEEEKTYTDYYMGFVYKTKDEWYGVNYRETVRYGAHFKTENEAMEQIMIRIKQLKKKVTKSEKVKDVTEVKVFVVSEEFEKIDLS